MNIEADLRDDYIDDNPELKEKLEKEHDKYTALKKKLMANKNK